MSRLSYSLAFYVLLMALLYVSQPEWLFTPEGQIRAFGLEAEESVFGLGVMGTVLAALCYFLFAMIDCLASS